MLDSSPRRFRTVFGAVFFRFAPRHTSVSHISFCHAEIVAFEKCSVERTSQFPNVGRMYVSSDLRPASR